jgi:hypothetical protein
MCFEQQETVEEAGVSTLAQKQLTFLPRRIIVPPFPKMAEFPIASLFLAMWLSPASKL